MFHLIESMSSWFPGRDRSSWQPYDFALKHFRNEGETKERRQLAAEQFSRCITKIITEWPDESMRKGIEESFGPWASISPTLAIRALVRHLRESDFTADFGQYISDEIFNLCLVHHERFAREAYLLASNSSLREVVPWFEEYDYLGEYLCSFPREQLRKAALEDAKNLAWLFLSDGDSLTTDRDRRLVAVYFNVHTGFSREILPEELCQGEMLPLAELGKTLAREGREPTPKEKASVAPIVQAMNY